jgi:hypothetical protein
LPLIVTFGPELHCPSHRCPLNSTEDGTLCVFKKSWSTSMFRLFPREKQELPKQMAMLAAGISGTAQLLF